MSLSFSMYLKAQDVPNIVIIYADDMGYGDLNCQNPNSKIPTPHLDQLASEGMRFTDAHSSSGICSPSRYALLTGQYHWRRTHKIVSTFGPTLFREKDITLPQLLKGNGFTTACIGKWHLGWDWEINNKPSGNYINPKGKTMSCYLPGDVKMDRAIGGGPTSVGFDYYFGDGTINFPPYCWIENDKALEIPTDTMAFNSPGFKTKEGKWEFRAGPKVKGWNPYDVLPTLTKKTVEWIGNQDKKKPFFLYFSLPAPHAPIIPNDEFIGKSKAGGYGDFMVQTDWVAGQVLKALKENGLEDNTIVIFTADNGPEKYAFDRAVNYGHFSMGQFRGLKRDVWEGGHHVPFIVKWPGKVKKGTVSNKLISQIDIMATLAEITNTNLPKGAAPDGYNIKRYLTDEKYTGSIRDMTIHNTFDSKWGIRKGDWLYINNKSGMHTGSPEAFNKLRKYKNFKTKGVLFNMKDDPEQRVNLYEKHPQKVKELKTLLQKEIDEKYTADYRTEE
jgi:arylsulfatase A-like enzyme